MISSGTTTSHTIPNLSNGTEYTVRVSATRTGANEGPASDEVMETPVMPTAPGVTVSETTLTVTEQDATGDSYTVVLDTEPTADVTVTVAGHSGTALTLTPDPATLTFTTTDWETAQTVTVTAGNDGDTADDTVALTHSAASADGDYGSITIAGVAVTVEDNDTAQVTGVMVEPGNGQLVVSWTAVDNATGYKVQWKSGGESYNTGDRQAVISSGTTTSHTIPNLSNGTEYTVQVSATRTGANEGPASDEVMETPVMPTAPGVTVSETALTILEGSTDTYTVVLGSQPAGNVTVTVSGHAGTDVSLDKTTLTFSATTWSTAQEVTVTAGEDGDADDETDVTLSHAVTSAADTDYNEITAASVVVSIRDNDTPGVAVSETDLTILEGNTETYTVFLTSQPTGDVTVTIQDPTDNTDVTADPATLTFTTTDWNVAQTVTVTVAQDDDAADETATITHAVSGYGTVATADDVAVTVEDDAPDALTVSFGAAAYSVKEEDDADTADVAENQAEVTVVLDADPKRTVTVPVTWDGQDGATAADFSGVPESVVFSRGETEKAFTFSALTDDVVDDRESVKLTFGTLPTGVSAGTPAEAVVSIDDTTRETLIQRIDFTGAENESLTVAGEFKVRVHFLPSADGLLQEELEITGGTIVAYDFEARPVGDGTVNVWYVNVLPDQEATTVTVRVPADVVEGGNQAAEVTYDTSPPLIAEFTTNATEPVIDDFRVTVTFSHDVLAERTGQESGPWLFIPSSDLAITRGTYVSHVMVSGKVWRITVTPNAVPGVVTVTLPKERVATGVATEVWNAAASIEVKAGKRSVDFEQAAYTAVEGGTVEVKVTLDADPLNTVVIPLTVTDQGGGGADDYSGIPASRTLTFNAGDTEKTFTFSAADDSIDDDGESVKFGIGTPLPNIVKRGSTTEATVSITDNDTAGVTFSETALTVVEEDGTGDSYTVVLDTEPTADVVVTVAGHSGTDVTPDPATLTFTTTDWETAQTVTVTAGDDGDTADDTVALTHSAASADTDYQGITIAVVTVTVPDNDTAQVTGVMVEPGNGQLVVSWTAVDNATGYRVQWKSGGESFNTDDRQAVISSGTTTSHTIGSLSNGMEYTVRVSATRTGANEGPASDEVMETPVMPTAPGVTVSETTLTVTEQDATGDSYTVVLDTEPTADVVVTVAGHSGTDVTPNPATLTFTTTDWATAQTVTVTAGDDADTADDTVALTHSAASADGDYGSITIAGVAVTVEDNDTAQVTGVMVEPGNGQLVVSWTAVDNATGYRVQWKSGGQGYNTDDRQAVISSGTTTSHTIGSLSNGMEYTVRVSATRTGANEGPASAEVKGTPVAPTTRTVTLALSDASIGEDGGVSTVTATVSPAAATAFTVTVSAAPVSPAVAADFMLSGNKALSFAANATTSTGVVTITGVDNDVDAADKTVTVSGTVSATGVTAPADRTLTLEDDDVAGVTVSETALTVAEEDGTGESYTVVLDTEPAADVVVTVAGHSGTDVTPNPATLTFTTTDWGTAQTVTVTAGDDDDTVNDAVALTHSAASADGDYGSITIAGVAVTVEDNDTAQVTGVMVEPGNGQLVVSWTAVDNATGYRVQWKSGGESFNTDDRQAVISSGTTTSHTIGSLSNGMEYTVRVSATRTGANEGLASAEVKGTPVAPTTRTVTLALSDASIGEDGGVSTVTATVSPAAATAFTVTVSAAPVSPAVAADFMLSGNKALSFAANATTSTGVVTITGVDNDVDAADKTVTVSGTVSATGVTAPADRTLTLEDDDVAGVTVSETALTVAEEDGTGESYTVVLDTEPTADVVVTVAGHSGTDVTPNPTTLTFTTTDWGTAQTVTVTAGDDDDTVNDAVALTHSAASADTDYQGITIAGVTVTVTDNDTAQVTGVMVAAGNAQLVVSWAAVANATGYQVQWKSGVESFNTGNRQATVSLGTTTTRTITGLTNGMEYTVRVSATRTGANEGLASAEVKGTPVAPTTRTVTLALSDASIGEDGGVSTVTATVSPAAATAFTVTVSAAPVSPAVAADFMLSGNKALSFAANATTSTGVVTITGVDNDVDAADKTVTVSGTVSATGVTAPADRTLTLEDDDVAGVTVSETALTVAEEDGTGESYTVVLDTEPTASVTVTVSGHADTDVSLDKTTLTFTTTDWETAQTVTVTAGNDADTADDTVALTHSAASTDSDYSGITIAGVAVTVEDNDTAQVTGVMVEPGNGQLVVSWTAVANATGYLVQWKSGGESFNTGNREATVSLGTTTTRTITGLTNGTEHTVRVSATRTGANEGAPSAEVKGTPVAPTTRTVTLALSDASIGEDGGVSTVTATVSPAAATAFTVTVSAAPVSPAVAADFMLSGNKALSFAANATTSTGVVTITGVDNDVDAADKTVTVSGTVSATGVTAPADLTLTLEDDDTAGVTVSETDLTILEGNTDSYTVALNTQPAGNVTVTVNDPMDNTDVTAEPATLTFTSLTWETAQTVTVSAAEDAGSDDETATVTHTVASTDGDYSGISASSVAVSVTDDDDPDDDDPDDDDPAVSFEMASYVATEGGTDAAVTVELSAPAPRQVDILLTAEGLRGAIATDWSGVPERLTFNAGDTAKTFTLVAVDDEVEDEGEMVELGFGVLPDGFSAGSPATALVTLMNDDEGPSDPVRNQCPNDSGERIVLISGGEIGEPGEVDFWRVEMDPGRFYVIELLGSEGEPDIMGEANPGGLTLSDPNLFAVWSGDGSEQIRRAGIQNRTRIVVERAQDLSGFQQFEVRSFGGSTGTYQIKIRVNNICVMNNGEAQYLYAGGPDGYRWDIPADDSTRDTLRPHPLQNVQIQSLLGDNEDWYWDQVPDEDWYAIEGLKEDYEYTVAVWTMDELPAKHQATRLKILGLYDNNGIKVPGTSSAGSGKTVSVTFQPDNTEKFYVSVGSDPSDRTGVYRISISARKLSESSN